MATRAEQLYEDDFYAWTRDQARALRRLAVTRPNVELDFGHLIEEVADLGIGQRDAVRSQLRRIIEHCLKLEYSRAREPRSGWHETIVDARIVLEDKLTPTLRRGLQRRLPKLYEQARRAAGASLRVHSESEAADALPPECPYGSPISCVTTGIREAGTDLSRDPAALGVTQRPDSRGSGRLGLTS